MFEAREFVHRFLAGLIVTVFLALAVPSRSQAHDWNFHGSLLVGSSHSHSDSGGDGDLASPKRGDDDDVQTTASTPSAAGLKQTPAQVPLTGPQAEVFEPFASTVTTHVDGQFLVVESNGLPSHQMMVGIKAWQQQVPLPQPFTGDNAWQLPLYPTPADNPVSVLKKPLVGAIALAVNGVPIFCALNNRGEDTLLAGELDRWGGHCGRGDDYHYHTAPVHLETQVGTGNPIAYALDGYPILGFTDADGSTPKDLDKFNGHADADGNYHYHATKTYPYINGGLTGVVKMAGSQVEQPRDLITRPSLPPLKGATITGFSQNGNDYDLEYEVSGKKSHVKYSILNDNMIEFLFVDSTGKTTRQVYHRGRIIQEDDKKIFYVVGLLLIGVVAAMVFGRRLIATDSNI